MIDTVERNSQAQIKFTHTVLLNILIFFCPYKTLLFIKVDKYNFILLRSVIILLGASFQVTINKIHLEKIKTNNKENINESKR